ncbi:MAG: TraB/GumN family protein [Chthoniobacterales bacterium]
MIRSTTLLGILFAVISLTARAEPAMWVIKDADSTIYLIGTLHLLKRDTEWNSEKVKKCVRESTELWLEITDFDDKTTMAALLAKFGLDPQHPLSTKLNDDQRKRLEKVATTYGIPVASLEPMRPWLAAVLLSAGPLTKAGYDPKSGVERILVAQATAEGDKIRGLETAEDQFRIFADLGEAEQIAFLESTMDDVEKGIELLDRLAKAWVDGDIAAIERTGLDEMRTKEPAVYDKLVVQRNTAWAEKIAGMLKGSGVEQIAVGALHLVGPDSVQAQLAKRGIKAERY